jgi:hypothetical protein
MYKNFNDLEYYEGQRNAYDMEKWVLGNSSENNKKSFLTGGKKTRKQRSNKSITMKNKK